MDKISEPELWQQRECNVLFDKIEYVDGWYNMDNYYICFIKNITKIRRGYTVVKILYKSITVFQFIELFFSFNIQLTWHDNAKKYFL